MATADRIIADAIALQRRTFASEGSPTAERRRDRLATLAAMLDHGEDALVAAVSADFGGRSPVETRLTDLLLVRAQLALARQKLAQWMKPRRVPTPIYLWPGRSRVVPQPLGIVGVIGAWNYPIATLLAPAVCALGAGNRVVLKPSEHAPETAQVMSRLIGEFFAPDVIAVTEGGPEVAAAFAGAAFDHILFTGSAAIGRRVAAAAAPNLTPVTLELGGKSPAILDPGCDLEAAAQAIAFGKFLNAGQTCVGVDYVLAPRAMHAPLAAALKRCFATMFPIWPEGGDYTQVISDRHFDRLNELRIEAVGLGARAEPLAVSEGKGRAMVPTLMFDATESMRIMREEIFGPLLPVVACEDVDAAIDYINARDRPLALYWFGRDRAAHRRIVNETCSGGVTINGTATHVFQRALPFGGVGPSGMGEYFGEAGFRRFSKEKAVFTHGPFNAMPLLAPPYTARTDSLLRLIQRLL